MRAPSGEQFEIAFGDQTAVVVEVGAGIRTYSNGGREILDGYGRDGMCTSGRGQLLVPWPNRIEDGRYEFEDQILQLPIDEVEHRNAIHGLVRWVPWKVVDKRPYGVVMEHTLHPQPGYPFQLSLRVSYRLTESGLIVELTATNTGTSRCPLGVGFHPYLRLQDGLVDDLELQIPAQTMLISNDRGIPTSAIPVEGTDYDFRSPRLVRQTVLDHAFTDFDREADGIARVHLKDRSTGSGVTLWVDQSYLCLMLFTGDHLPDVGRRSIAVEPMTCPPNAFRSRESLVVLGAGESFTGCWGIEPT